MINASMMSVLISFALSAMLGPLLIPFLRRLKAGQTVRDDGPKAHLKKNGTPTMGGVLILISVTAASLLFVKDYPMILPVLFMMLGFGMVGFLDDYLKVVLRRSMGLTPWQKLAGQLLVTGIFAYYLLHYTDISLAMRLPFTEGHYLEPGVLAVPAMIFIVLGTVNGANLTDGLDGLAGSVTVIIAVFFTVAAIGTGSGIAPITCAVAGALMGFLLFNVYPASVFMGDTGSLALGGFVAASAWLLQLPLYLVLVCFIYLIEAVSVILQVGYYKISGGKRIFKMAPLHHHFELCGWSETRIVALFSIITAIMCLAALMGIR